LIIEDGKCEGKDAISAAQKLINVDRVQVIVGGLCSSETLAAGKIAQQYNIPMISPISSAPEISEIGDALFKFYDDRDLTKNLANYVNSLQVKKVVALMEQSDSPVAFVNAFAEYFSGEVVKMSTLPTEKDFTLLAKQLKSNIISSDFVLFVASNSAFLIDGLRAFDKEGILTMMEGNIAGNEQMLGNDVLTNAEL
jgi:branched-chain amino acid transport system substrate-binding protein